MSEIADPSRPAMTCPVCGGTAWEEVADDVVRCTNCSYLWIAPRRE